MSNQIFIQKLISRKILKDETTLYIKYKKILQQDVEILNEIIMHTSFLQYDANIKTRIHCILKNITNQPVCSVCGCILKMRLDGRYRYTFSDTCGSKCFSSKDEVKNKRKQTNMKKYGSSNFLTSEQGSKQRVDTLLEKYGVDNAGKIESGKLKRKTTIIDKYGSNENFVEIQKTNRKATFIKKHGVEHAMHVPDIKQKQKDTVMDRYGVNNVWHSEEIQKKRFDTMREKYDVEYALQNDSCREKFMNTMVDKYGVEHALQNTTLNNKADISRINTNVEKYGVKYFYQTYVSSDSLQKLQNKEWMIEQHHTNKYTITHISKMLDVAHSTITTYFKKHNIEVLTINNSQAERDIITFIKHIIPDVEVITNSKSIISPLELDIYIPDLQLAIEYNGIFWHGELNGKDKKYHLTKTNECNKLGIRLVHINENEWILKQDIVKSRLKNLLKQSTPIYARKCQIVELTSLQKREFLNNSHIQGDGISSINYGLEYDGKLVSVMTFGKSRFSKKYEYELIRYANVINSSVVGGASKIFKHFIKQHQPNSIITYSDVRWNTGNLYKQLGFTFKHRAAPNYFYFKPTNVLSLHSRNTFQKHKLEKKLDVFDSNLTEWQNMVINEYDRIWDCGNDVFVWTN